MGFGEILIIAVLTLLVVGPERLPDTIRGISRWLYTIKHQFQSVKQSVENELGIDEIRRDVHNTQIMQDLQKMEEELHSNNIAIDPHANQSKVSDNEQTLEQK